MNSRTKAFREITKRTFKEWWHDEPMRESAVIAFFAIVSLPALLVLILNFAGLFFEKEVVRNELGRQIKSSINPETAEQLQKAMENAGEMDKGVLSTILGILIILFGATRVFIHLQKTLNYIWEVKRSKRPYRNSLINNLFSIGLILTIGFLLLVSMALSTFLAAASHKLQGIFPQEIVYLFYVLEFLISLSVISVLFTLMFKYLPDVKIAFRNVIPGAILTGILFTVLKYGLSLYFARVNPGSVYGTAGSIVLVMFWVAIASMIIFFGAEFTKQYADYHKIPIDPKIGAKKQKKMTDEDEGEPLTTNH